MSNHWMCPKCKAVFEKSYFVKTIQAESKGIDFSHLTCKLCNERVSMHKLAKGFYDAPAGAANDNAMNPVQKFKKMIGIQ